MTGARGLPWPLRFLPLIVCLAAVAGAAPAAGAELTGHEAGPADGAVRTEPVPAASGERCLVCRQAVGSGGIAVLHRGRRVPLHPQACLREWQENADSLFASLQPRGALFQESSTPSSSLASGWFLLGLIIVAGLVAGAVCAYIAVARGRSPLLWFFAGLALDVIALAVLLALPRVDTSKLPAGIPPGLAKVPTTRAPVPCLECGAENHPAAGRCSGCGATLLPSAEPELQRLRT